MRRMKTLIVLSGVPGSGKSYFAHSLRDYKKGHVYIISSDAIRDLVTGNQQDLTEDPLMWKMYYELAKVYSADPNAIVILDATNKSAYYRVETTKQLSSYFDKFILIAFDIDEDTVLRQNLDREFPIPTKAVKEFLSTIELPNEIDKGFFNEVYIVKNDNFEDIIKKL